MRRACIRRHARWLLVGVAFGGTGCAGPVQILRESGDPLERIAAAQELKTEPDEGRIEALSDALNDADQGVRQAAADALGALGDEGREALIEGLTDERSACAAAPVLAKQAAKFPEVAKSMDPTVGRRRSDSCVVKTFERLGAATHAVLIEAILSDEKKRRKRGHYLACRIEPPLTEGLQEVLTGPEDGGIDDAESTLGALLRRRHKHCGDKPETVWNAIFADPSVRHRAITIVEDHDRRAELIEPLVQTVEACIGPDALLLAMDAGYSPGEEDLQAFTQSLDAAGESRCPTVDPAAMIATLLAGGLTAGTLKESRGRLDMIERLGWLADTTRAKVYVAVIRTNFLDAAGFGPPSAGPLLEAVQRWRLTPEQRKAAFEALVKVGPAVLPAIEKALPTIPKADVRDGLITVVQAVAGQRSPRVVTLAVAEFERATDDKGIVAAPMQRQQFLTGVIKAAGTKGSPALATETLKPDKPSFRSMLFNLLVQIEGKKGKVLAKVINDLLDSARSDLVIAAAAGHLATSNPKAATARVSARVKEGTLTPGDRRVLASLLASDAKKLAKSLGKILKKVDDPAGYTAVAEAFAEVGLHGLALSLAAASAKSLHTKSAAAAASGDNKRGIQLGADAARMEAVRDKAVRGLYQQSLDDSLSAKQRVKALKTLLKGTKKGGLGSAGDDVVSGLKEALADETNKKMKKAMKKAYKTLKKRI